MRRRAFTLLELLLAMAITVTIAGTLASALHTGYRARNATQRAIAAARTTGLVTQIIARDLESALQPSGILASEFQGEVDSLAFYTTAPEPSATTPADIRRVEYSLVTGADGRMDLVRRVNNNLLQTVEDELPEEPICRGISLLELSYYDGESWNENWNSTEKENTLPLAVRMTLEVLSPREGARPLRCDQFIELRCGNAAPEEEGEGQ